MVLPGADRAVAIERCEALQQKLREHEWTPLTGDVPVRASVGVVTAFARSSGQADLLSEADRNVYAAKAGGRDRIVATHRAASIAADPTLSPVAVGRGLSEPAPRG